ncbi:MAG: putative DNA binding domain-containing protein [Anaerolineae bacterium]|nr:putative DNA binding domain-containing protein [Anaerolineae bacterium]
MARRRKPRSQTQWRRVDLHIHTPASADYQEPGISFLDILRQADSKGLDIIAFTDHNTVAGYRQMREEIHHLELLERLGRLRKEEKEQLHEYRRLLSRILVLPGFEFTATFGFHILGIFSPETDLRELEFLLRRLNVPLEKLDQGSAEVGATTDVLTAYRAIAEAGGIVIAAHANSANGVAMRGFDFGGQTRIAYTQDPNLHALEVTDLDKKGPRTTAHFFDGSKPEYPRRMRCIQGSDAHRLTRDPNDPRHLGIGDRVTEVLLPQVSFQALRAVFLSGDFTLTRPFRPAAKVPFDYIQAAREEGPTIVQDFHERYSQRGGYLDAILCDICAFANTNGGTLYIGVSADPRHPPVGVGNPRQAIEAIQAEVARRITPPLEVAADVQETQGKKVVRLLVPRGADPPYAIDDNKIYIRSESETGLAVRDEIVSLVRRALAVAAEPEAKPRPERAEPSQVGIEPPRTGVEIIATEERQGVRYHTMRDLRNGNVVTNVTRQSARRLWHYAITQAEDHPVDPDQLHWEGEIALIRRRERGGQVRYDLAQREDGRVRIYYGVTDDGIHGPWARLVGLETE